MAEQFFKNVQLLTEVPVDEFMGTMGLIAAKAAFQNCDDPQQHPAYIYAKALGL
jgi:signal transduction protein with GAF and PtsI domain